jgi:hypothetical protein
MEIPHDRDIKILDNKTLKAKGYQERHSFASAIFQHVQTLFTDRSGYVIKTDIHFYKIKKEKRQ